MNFFKSTDSDLFIECDYSSDEIGFSEEQLDSLFKLRIFSSVESDEIDKTLEDLSFIAGLFKNILSGKIPFDASVSNREEIKVNIYILESFSYLKLNVNFSRVEFNLDKIVKLKLSANNSKFNFQSDCLIETSKMNLNNSKINLQIHDLVQSMRINASNSKIKVGNKSESTGGVELKGQWNWIKGEHRSNNEQTKVSINGNRSKIEFL